LGVIIKQQPIENIVFEGGGPKGLVYVGAINELEERGILKNVKNVGGSSAGAMTALAVGLGYNAQKIKNIISQADISSFLDTSDAPSSYWITSTKHGLSNLFGAEKQGKGYYLGNKLKQWAKDVILGRFKLAQQEKEKNGENGKKYESIVQDLSEKDITFKILEECRQNCPELGIKKIAFTGTNYTDAKLEVFDFDKTPDMPVDLAVRISMSLPWFFQSVKYKGKEYMDGGCLNNYPMFIFNTPPYFEPGMNRVLTGQQGVSYQNLCTLGLRVDSLDEIQTILWETAKKESESTLGKFWTKLKNQAVNSLVGVNITDASKQLDLETYNQYPHRTIQIPDLDYSTFKFDLDKSDKDKLEDSGYKATEEWLSLYYDNAGVEIEIESRKDWDKFCSFNELTHNDITQIENEYNSVLSKLK
jgi:NTE family protein